MIESIEIPDYLPDNQKQYLKNLINKSQGDKEALFAVNAIIDIIRLVEFIHTGKGKEILKGAHIVAANSEIYQELINNTKNRDRISSHYRGQKQEEKGINLKTTADFLVGLNNNDKAWLQLEGHKVSFEDGLIRGAILLVLHMIDYLQYKFTGKNVGPSGLSEYVESKPIVINPQSIDILNGLEVSVLGKFFNSTKLKKTIDNNDQSKSKPFTEKINRQNKTQYRIS